MHLYRSLRLSVGHDGLLTLGKAPTNSPKRVCVGDPICPGRFAKNDPLWDLGRRHWRHSTSVTAYDTEWLAGEELRNRATTGIGTTAQRRGAQAAWYYLYCFALTPIDTKTISLFLSLSVGPKNLAYLFILVHTALFL